MNAQQARRHREAQRARAAARRRRQRRLRLGMVAALAVVLVAGVGAVAVAAAHRGRHPATTTTLAGLQTGPAPWGANTADLAERLQAIGVPPLSPVEGTVIHIHQHLDIFVDGHQVTVPAGVGIDPAAGYAPLHTHDPSGIVHVESPTVRSYTLGEFFAVWGVRLTATCLGGYCGGGRELRVYVNGRPYQGDPTGLVLAAHQELVVAFGTAAQLPSPVPSGYPFPAGL